ncbi:MAG: hypothetical protein IJD70_05855 [Clostridia bacterium]|nr:hypothetical protein [Clostridia bacterium]
MYLLRKIGIPLAALLILSILTLIVVVLLFERNGIFLPSFELPATEPAVTTAPNSPENTVGINNYEYINTLKLEEY